MSVSAQARSGFRLAGRSFLAFILAPDLPLATWLAELDRWMARSKGFFAGRPVVLDLSGLSLSKPDVAGLLAQIQARAIRVIGVEGIDPAWLGPNLAPLAPINRPDAKPATVIDFPDPGSNEPDCDEPVRAHRASGRNGAAAARPPVPDVTGLPETVAPATLLISKPVRSGQSVIYPQGDVTVVGSIASGAEVIAGGSIHVYGALKGRAIAGSTGDTRARIFCGRFDSELIAINGLYQTADDVRADVRGMPVQVYLDGQAMVVAPL